MTDLERLSALTEHYLKSLVCGVSGSVNTELDAAAPFAELGIDSFRVLKIIKSLETDFGVLPKTLMFEHFNIRDLAQYFVAQHAPALTCKFARDLSSCVDPDGAARVTVSGSNAPSGRATAPQSAPTSTGPVLMLEKDAYAHVQWGELLRNIFSQYSYEGSVSRGTRTIAPNLFIGTERKGFFNYARSGNIILTYAYTGPRDHFPVIAHEMYQHCAARGYELNVLAEEELTSIGGIPFSSTPFGALQRILNLQSFTLEGGDMRRLRYLVSKFTKAGACRTEEYRHGIHPERPEAIATIIDQWCGTRTLVNPLIHSVKEEILAGTLDPEHRVFVTYVDDVLQNVILISPLSAEQKGYLMDLEFYPPHMPQGGLEFAIVRIIETLVAEGCDVLSLGGTYGCKLAPSSNADPAVDRILDDLRSQNIFNDAGNLQFKNKFRPQNTAIFLCRPVGQCKPDNVLDIIMMIADPLKTQTSDQENQCLATPATQARTVVADDPAAVIEGHERSRILAANGFNPLNIPAHQVEFDLRTDSWAQLEMPAIGNYAKHLHGRLHEPADLDKTLRALFPFAHFALTTSGRTAERVLYKAWSQKGLVPQNLLFPTTLLHQIDQGFTPRELPHPQVFHLESRELYKGNLDLPALRKLLSEESTAIALVCIELSDNAAGGYPVSLEHLRSLRAELAGRAIPLVMDATRVLENALFLIENEEECRGRSVWQVAREIMGHADAVVVSLAKDFCVKGGLIGTNDATLADKLQELIREETCSLDVIDRKLVALSLQDRRYIESQAARRKRSVERIWSALEQHGVAIARPSGGHCILIDVKGIPELSALRHPVPSFLAWLYLNTGIRAGAHSVGMQKDSAINDLVRLAIPLGLKHEQVDAIIERLVALFADRRNVPEIVPVEGAQRVGNLYARYRLHAYHRFAGLLVSSDSPSPKDVSKSEKIEPAAAAAMATAATAATAVVATAAAPTAGVGAIAVIGMAGRYPKAANLRELWQNLLQGMDSIEDIPAARLALRPHPDSDQPYRGGFIDDVDRFDASFFSISSTDAPYLDPQERLFLQVAYEAIEDAGYYPETLCHEGSGRDVGVFVGAVWSLYQMLGAEDQSTGSPASPNSFFWSIANRVSYWMNLSGPSLTLDAACSASLTALHLACEAIHRGECSAAIVGAVNLDLHRRKLEINAAGGALSKSGVCRSFGKGADGYVAGEGVGALLLKPLDRAIADGDNIHGVIRSTVVSHSGKTSGYTIPSPQTQTRMILKALERAQVDARSIGYVEAHGTGTDLGDCIEVAALTSAFQQHGVEKQRCALGSIKPNIGHLEAASGIVGVQKILLQMKHRKLVPSLHSADLNENIDFASSPFRVQQQVAEWQSQDLNGVRLPRRAGISTIGAGGTNAHVILEEYEPAPPAPSASAEECTEEKIFPLSARTEDQLYQSVARLRDLLCADARLRADDVAHTLQTGRKAFEHRLAVVAKTCEELVEKLTAFLERREDDDLMPGHLRNSAAITKLLSPRAKQELIQLVIQSGDRRGLARLWSDGVILEWRGLDIGQTGRKVSLPTYPFANERFWIARRRPGLHQLNGVGVERRHGSSAPIEHAVPLAREPAPPVVDRRVSARYTDRYRFSLGHALESLSGQRMQWSADQKAKLFALQMFARQLRMPIDEVNEDCHLMDTGLTSLDMAEMTQAIKDQIDASFSPTAFFECTTVRSFVTSLADKYAAVFQRMTATRVAADEDLAQIRRVATSRSSEAQRAVLTTPLHVQDAQSELPAVDIAAKPMVCTEPMRRVFLTGATGFLGIHVLAELLSSELTERVYCLVRAQSKQQGLQRIRARAASLELAVDETRITVVCGDSSAPRLGLSAEDWDLCCQQAQQIVHASAHVNHIEGYATFRDSTAAMKEVIRLATSGQLKLIQFTSSIAGCLRKIGDEFSFYEKEDFIAEGEHVYGGYGQSKWAQEILLKRAHELGVPYVIYRFGELSGASRSGLGQTQDMLHRLLQMRLAVGCREKISSDVLDMLPVDCAAKLIVQTGRTPDLWNAILHATHPKPYSFANLYRKAQDLGLEFKPVTRTRYLKECHEFVRFIYSINPVNGFVLECVLRDAEGSVRNRKMMDGYFSVIFPFEQSHFKRALRTVGLTLPGWDALVNRYFERWQEDACGFIARILDYQRWRGSEEVQTVAVTPRNMSALKESVIEKLKSRPVPRKNGSEGTLLGNVHEA